MRHGPAAQVAADYLDRAAFQRAVRKHSGGPRTAIRGCTPWSEGSYSIRPRQNDFISLLPSGHRTAVQFSELFLQKAVAASNGSHGNPHLESDFAQAVALLH